MFRHIGQCLRAACWSSLVSRQSPVAHRAFLSSASPFGLPKYETVKVDSCTSDSRLDPGVAVVTLNRPSRLNALNTLMSDELSECLGLLSSQHGQRNEFSDVSLRAVVLTGASTPEGKPNAFCAGADLRDRDGMTDAQWLAQHKRFQILGTTLREMPCPVICAVDGVALGGGFEIALLSDWIVCSKTSRFGVPEVTRGIIPGLGGTQTLPRLIGKARAKQIMFTGRFVHGPEALEIGIVTECTPEGEALAVALKNANTIASNAAPGAVRQAKKAVDFGMECDLRTGWSYSLECYAFQIPSPERHEGVRAFNERRPPDFSSFDSTGY